MGTKNDFCITMGSSESCFNVLLILRGKVWRQCPQTTTFEEKGELKWEIEPMLSAYQPNAILLGHTGSEMERGTTEGWVTGSDFI